MKLTSHSQNSQPTLGRHFTIVALATFVALICTPSGVFAQESQHPPHLDPNRDGYPGIEVVQYEINKIVRGQVGDNVGTKQISNYQQGELAQAYAGLGGVNTVSKTGRSIVSSGKNPVGPSAPHSDQVLVSNADPEVLQEAVRLAIENYPEYASAIIADLLRYFGADYLDANQGYLSAIVNGGMMGSPTSSLAIAQLVQEFFGDNFNPQIAALINNGLISANNLMNVGQNLASLPFVPGTTSLVAILATAGNDEDEEPVTPVRNR